MILCERKINIEKDMLLKDKNQSKRTIKMDLNNFDKTLLRDVIGKKENNEKSYLSYLFILLIFTAQSATILVLILPLTARFVNMFQCTGSDRWTPARGDTTASIGVRSHERKREIEIS